ncbi:hypothetical protein EJ04DRAFT_572692 [Polyplosphaeria fusca]|uniref:F-box domain-containing protein n=1 Tax=Polyplosphaeria fusca TaxID=682080 RepID=A0A9P4RB11_9PLEO|nr:hypothetical protein EJ04DRAFT_572692 [Polyplosphaeria fusca]
MGLLLPAELQLQIFSFLERHDLKAVRAVCRAFRDNASPHLFKSALVCARYRALSTLKLISLHESYRKYVKEIIFDGSVYLKSFTLSSDRYRAEADHHEGLRVGFSREKFLRHGRYKQLYEEQEEMRKDGVLLMEVARALEWLPNVSSVIYSPGPRTVPIEAKLVRDLLPRGVASELDVLDADYTETSQHGIHHLIAAAHMTQYTGIREFRIDALDEASDSEMLHVPGIEFTIAAFQFPSPDHIEAGKFFFSNLHKLDINLSLCAREARLSPLDFAPLDMLANFSTLLTEAADLQELSLNITHWRASAGSMYGHIVGTDKALFPYLGLGATWKFLRVLRLGGVYTSEPQLLGFVSRHKDTLSEAHFTHCSLVEGIWANVVDEIVYGTEIFPFSLHFVNETDIEGTPFHALDPEHWIKWQYVGRILKNREGQRYYESSTTTLSVYARREQQAEE